MGESALKALLERFSVTTVVTPNKDSSLYRSQPLLPVEKLARSKKIKIAQTNSLADLHKIILSDRPDAVVIASYNKVIPQKTLSLTKFINVHHGDLPRWRGRANLNWAIIMGRKSVGLTIHDAASDLDAGSIYRQFKLTINDRETIQTLYDKVNLLLEAHLAEVVEKVLNGYLGCPQKGTPTYCCTRLPEDGLINWTQSTIAIDRLIRALTRPFPGAFSYVDGKKIIIWNAEIPKKPLNYAAKIPGRVVAIHNGLGVEVLTGSSSIVVKEIGLDGVIARADKVIKSVKKTFGINPLIELEKVQKRLERLERLLSA